MPDRLDKLIDQWSHQRPDLHCSGLDVVARIQNVAKLLRREEDNALVLLRLKRRKYAALSTLRRRGQHLQRTSQGHYCGRTAAPDIYFGPNPKFK